MSASVSRILYLVWVVINVTAATVFAVAAVFLFLKPVVDLTGLLNNLVMAALILGIGASSVIEARRVLLHKLLRMNSAAGE
jgi:hypothetical protein